MPKPIRKARKIRRSHGGPKGSQPGPRHPPGIQQGPRVRPQGGLQRKAMHTPGKIAKTKFETLTNQQNASVSQYVPSTTVNSGFGGVVNTLDNQNWVTGQTTSKQPNMGVGGKFRARRYKKIMEARKAANLQPDYTMNPATGVPEYTGDFTGGISPTNFQREQWDTQSINQQRELFNQMPSGTGSIMHTGPSARVHVEAAGGKYTYGNSYVFYPDGSYEEIAKGSQ